MRVLAAVLNPIKVIKRAVLPTNKKLTAGLLESLRKRLVYCLGNWLVNFFAQYCHLMYRRAFAFLSAQRWPGPPLNKMVLVFAYGVYGRLRGVYLRVLQSALTTIDLCSSDPTKILGQYINDISLASINLRGFVIIRCKLALLSYREGSVDCYLWDYHTSNLGIVKSTKVIILNVLMLLSRSLYCFIRSSWV